MKTFLDQLRLKLLEYSTKKMQLIVIEISYKRRALSFETIHQLEVCLLIFEINSFKEINKKT